MTPSVSFRRPKGGEIPIGVFYYLRRLEMTWDTEGTEYHKPVLLKEVIEFLKVRPGKKYIDATVGEGGHTAAILENGGTVLGIDVDPCAVELAKKRFAAEIKNQKSKIKIVRGNFKDIGKIAKGNGFEKVSGVLFDLGLSSFALERSGRGFSFQKDEPLDMRMDPNLAVTAADLVNGLTKEELDELFQKFGEEARSSSIARAIVSARRVKPIRTSRELADLVRVQIPPHSRMWRDPATKVFQALRIAVNDELSNLRIALPRAAQLLEPGGRLVVISFHSGEDRIVKRFFERPYAEECGKVYRITLETLTKRPVRPSAGEVERNPQARSAKMRVAERKNSSKV